MHIVPSFFWSLMEDHIYRSGIQTDEVVGWNLKRFRMARKMAIDPKLSTNQPS